MLFDSRSITLIELIKHANKYRKVSWLDFAIFKICIDILQRKLILKKMPFYAVARGRKPGIYETWDECKLQTDKFSKPKYKKFQTLSEAENFILQYNPYFVKNSTTRTAAIRAASNSSTKSANNASKKSTDNNSNVKLGSKGFMEDSDGYVHVYTDGACSMNGYAVAKAGIGIWFGENHPLNVSRPVKGRMTNNCAEIEAVTEAAKLAHKAGIHKLKINTDSKFLISCTTEWIPRWKQNGWKTAGNKPVINKEELLEMEKAIEPLEIAWNHVNGHVGIYGNEMADKLARAGCTSCKSPDEAASKSD